METLVHPFERAGLGQAPYRFIGSEVSRYQACPGAPIQPGASCDYCGTGISQVFRLRSADGRVFKVGCDCIEKAHDPRLTATVNVELRRLQREKRATKAVEDHAKLQAMLADEALRGLAAQKPHPSISGRTLLDYADWMFKNAGASGTAAVLKTLRTLSA